MKKILTLLFILLTVNAAFASSQGAKLPTAATGNTGTIGGGTIAWTNQANIEANDGVSATCLPGVATTNDLRGGGFGFAVPTGATVLGIKLDVNATAAVGGIEKFNFVALEGGGGASANRATAATLTTSFSTFSFGGPTDLWGTTWTPAQINAGGFVGNISFVANGSGPGTLSVDYMQITVTFTGNSSGFLPMFGFNKKPEVKSQTRAFRIH